MKRFSSLRVRLTLWTVALEAFLLLLFALILIFVIQSAQNRQIEESLRSSAVQLNSVLDVEDGVFLAPSDETADLRARGVLAWIVSPEGDIEVTVGDASQYPPPSLLPARSQFGNGQLANDLPARLLVAPADEGEDHVVILAIPLTESQTFLRQILLGLVIVIPIVLVISMVGGLFLANRALSPVATITQTARQISAVDLSQRINLNLPDDEIGRLANTFDDMLARLQQAFQREQKFTSDVSHELRTPLGILKTQLSLARSRQRDAATLLQMMSKMEGDVDRMTRLVEQMLTLARVEQHGLPIFVPLDLRILLTDLVNRLQVNAQEHAMKLQLELPRRGQLIINGSEERLRQVFTNLIENGVKYSANNGMVSITANQNGDGVDVTVSDSGIGIAAEHLPHLFERFYRVDDARTRDTGGAGLGLAITHAVIQAHHGEISVQSEPGQGTTFTISLLAEPGGELLS